ncbi:unnamed protein product, partial [Aureobasidium pullulans]
MTREDGFTSDRWQEDEVQKKTRKILGITDLIPSYSLLSTIMPAYVMSKMLSNSLLYKKYHTTRREHILYDEVDGKNENILLAPGSYAKLGPLSRRRGANPGRGIIDLRRVFVKDEKRLYKIRHRKNIAIDMLLIIYKSTQKETALYYHPLTFGREMM